MLVTQSYKTVTLSDDAYMHVQLAVLTQMKSDRAAKRMPGDEYDKFLQQQLALGVKAMSAMNAATVTVTAVMASDAARGTLADLDEGMQRLVIRAVHGMRVTQVQHLRSMVDGKRKYDEGVECCMAITAADVERARAGLEEVDAALLFLENPK